MTQKKETVPTLSPEEIKKLLEEGRELRKIVEKRAAPMKRITWEDLKRRVK